MRGARCSTPATPTQAERRHRPRRIRRAVKADGHAVIEFTRTFMVGKRGFVPESAARGSRLGQNPAGRRSVRARESTPHLSQRDHVVSGFRAGPLRSVKAGTRYPAKPRQVPDVANGLDAPQHASESTICARQRPRGETR